MPAAYHEASQVIALAEAGFAMPSPADLDGFVAQGVLDLLWARGQAAAQRMREAEARRG